MRVEIGLPETCAEGDGTPPLTAGRALTFALHLPPRTRCHTSTCLARATQLHPDKCKLPGSTEAFKKVSAAYACLNDSGNRSTYDTFGTDSPAAAGGGGNPFQDVDTEQVPSGRSGRAVDAQWVCRAARCAAIAVAGRGAAAGLVSHS